jgi:hypothetical protein
MNRPPRAVHRPILTGFGIWRVIFVGLALLAVTLWAFFWMKSQGASDQRARTVAVNMITIGGTCETQSCCAVGIGQQPLRGGQTESSYGVARSQ